MQLAKVINNQLGHAFVHEMKLSFKGIFPI